MRIDWKVLDKMLLGETETDDITLRCKKDITEFVQTHNFDVFSNDSLKELAGIFSLSIGPAYEAITNTKIPNIFYVLKVKEEENEDEREPLSSGII